MTPSSAHRGRGQRVAAVLWAVLLTGILGIGAPLVGARGVSSDENTEVQMLGWHLTYAGRVLDGTATDPASELPRDTEFYGTLFNALSVVPYLLSRWDDSGSALEIIESGRRSGEIYRSKHGFTFAFGLLAFVATGLLGRLISGSWSGALLATLLLVMTPRYWGHSFFNPKDIPFAVLFTLSTLAAATLAPALAELLSSRRLGSGRLSARTAAVGALIGATAAVRVPGLVLIGFVLATALVLHLLRRPGEGISSLRWLALQAGVLIASSLIVVLLFSPVLWTDPFLLFHSAAYFANHSWHGCVLTLGDCLPAREMPWYYLPVWFGITTPLVLLLMVPVALVVLGRRMRTAAPVQQSALLLISLQAFAVPLAAILLQSTVYNGVRHFLFVWPALAVLGGSGAAVVLHGASSTLRRVAFAAVLSLGLIAVARDAVRLFPYEHVYFNEVARLVEIDENFEVDYWALSLREGQQWINGVAETGATVVSTKPYPALFSRADLSHRRLKILMRQVGDERALVEHARPFYYLTHVVHDKVGLFRQCDLVHAVRRPLGRQQLTLAIVRHCAEPVPAKSTEPGDSRAAHRHSGAAGGALDTE